jgi:hypothetical protein
MITYPTGPLHKLSLFIATWCLFFGVTLNAHAGLIGQSVFGVLNLNGDNTTNYFDPANVGLSQSALNEISNPVIIPANGLEFSYVDNGVNGVFANFTDDGLFITNDVVQSPFASWVMSFQSAGFIGLVLAEVSDNFNNGGVGASLVNDTLTFTWAGTDSGATFGEAVYSLLAPSPPGQALPLPGTLSLFGAGLAALAFMGRRKKRKPQLA